MTATLTRSTKAITDFVAASRKLAALKLQAKQLEAEIERLTPNVLEQIGDGRTVNCEGIVTLTPRVSESVKMLDKDAALAFWETHGLKVSTQPPRYVAPASFRAEVLKGSVPQELYTIEQTIGVNVI